MKKLLFLLPVLFFFVQCNKNKTEKGVEVDEAPKVSTKVEEPHQGEKNIHMFCNSCHLPTDSEEAQSAPPFIAVKRRYMQGNPTQEEFTKKMLDFIKNPTNENALMKKAVEKYGLMPKSIFTDDIIIEIADYLYNNEPVIPDWFEKHYQENHGKHAKHNGTGAGQGKGYLPKGKKIALQTKGVLGKNLMGAIQKDGTEAALAFCSTKAIPLTDSMSVALNTKIKRVSDKNRNPNNVANKTELDYINLVKKQLAKGEAVKPQMQNIGGKHVGYYPILTNQMCLQCHGTPNKQVKPATLAKINEKYPTDKALGYGENELRGIWVIQMD